MKSSRRSAKTAREAGRLTQQLMLAPMVMAMRMPILAAEASRSLASPRPESAAAVGEKVKAMAEGALAAQLAFFRGAALMPFALMRATSAVGPLVDLAGDVAVAAMKPAALRVGKNHRRLSKQR